MGADPRPVDVPELAPPGPAWSQAVVHGDTVYVSGQVAWDADCYVVGEGSASEQAELVFGNVQRALEAAGSSIGRLIRITIYLTSAEIIPEVRLVRDRWLTGIQPASTLVVVSALADPRLVVEIDAVAARNS